jgi:hypothetical protein
MLSGRATFLGRMILPVNIDGVIAVEAATACHSAAV